MSKRVTIVLPDEMPLGSARRQITKRPKPKANLKSSIKSAPSIKADLPPPVFMFVSPQISGSSGATSPRARMTTPSDSSLNNWVRREPSTGGSLDVGAEAATENSALIRPGSGSSNNKLESCSSIKQFLRNTVALVRAGESFTSVKNLFYNFIKSSSSYDSEEELARRRATQESTSQLVRTGNPYLCPSNDSLVSNSTPHLSPPRTSQVTTCAPRSDFLFNPMKYDMPTSWLSDVSPLTGCTPYSTQLSPKEAGYQSDVSQKSYASVQAPSTSQGIAPTLAQPKCEDVAMADSDSLPATLPAEVGLSGSHLEKDFSPEEPQGEEIKAAAGLPEILTLVCDAWATSPIRGSGGSSSRSSPPNLKGTRKGSPWRSPKMSPRRNAPTTVASESAMVLVSAPETHSQDNQSARSSGSSQRSIQTSVREAAKKTPLPSPRNSVTSGMSQKVVEVPGEEPSSQMERIPRSSENEPENLQRSSQMSRRVNFVFAIVSPEEERPSQPGGSSDKGIEENSTCRTYQEECKCHHCQDMRRAVKRVEYFQSPEGQKRMESKLLAKNFFMDLCALSKVREQIQADLYGTRSHPPARVSYPVSICGANRMDGGSLNVKWFTHDVDCVDHFDLFVDDKLSKSVFNKRATSTVLIDVNASSSHRLKMRAVPVRGFGAQATPVDKLMSEVAAGHMRNVRQGQLFARCLEFLDAEPQRSLVDYWTDSEFLYMPTSTQPPCQKGR